MYILIHKNRKSAFYFKLKDLVRSSIYPLLGILLALPLPCYAKDFDWSDYDKLLKQYVVPSSKMGIKVNLVDYTGLSKSKKFNDIASRLKHYQPHFLTPNHKIAFYTNAYNYFTLKLVADKRPEKSIRDLGNILFPVWNKEVGYINNKAITLDHIEHKILRHLGEPRIHFAIVCASLSCPDLRREAYSAGKLESQLEQQTILFLENTQKGATVVDGELFLSKIFEWFEVDFDHSGGVIEFVSKYNPKYQKYAYFETLDYDWSLNAK